MKKIIDILGSCIINVLCAFLIIFLLPMYGLLFVFELVAARNEARKEANKNKKKKAKAEWDAYSAAIQPYDGKIRVCPRCGFERGRGTTKCWKRGCGNKTPLNECPVSAVAPIVTPTLKMVGVSTAVDVFQLEPELPLPGKKSHEEEFIDFNVRFGYNKNRQRRLSREIDNEHS